MDLGLLIIDFIVGTIAWCILDNYTTLAEPWKIIIVLILFLIF